MNSLPYFMTPQNVVDLVQIKARRPSTVVRSMQRRGLRVLRINRQLRVRRTDLLEYLESLEARADDR